jgi:hypothetical protein
MALSAGILASGKPGSRLQRLVAPDDGTEAGEGPSLPPWGQLGGGRRKATGRRKRVGARRGHDVSSTRARQTAGERISVA